MLKVTGVKSMTIHNQLEVYYSIDKHSLHLNTIFIKDLKTAYSIKT